MLLKKIYEALLIENQRLVTKIQQLIHKKELLDAEYHH